MSVQPSSGHIKRSSSFSGTDSVRLTSGIRKSSNEERSLKRSDSTAAKIEEFIAEKSESPSISTGSSKRESPRDESPSISTSSPKRESPRDESPKSGSGSDSPDSLTKRVDSTARRKEFALSKSQPRLQLGVAINQEQFAKLDPKSRTAIRTALKERTFDLEVNGAEDDSIIAAQPILSPRAISAASKKTEEVQTAKRHENFLNALEQVDQKTLKGGLFFFNDGMISTNELFELIKNRILLRLKDEDETPVMNLLIFSIGWLNNNEEAKLVKKAEKAIRTIVAAAQSYKKDNPNAGSKYIQKEGESLEKALTAALQAKKALPAPEFDLGWSGGIDFEKNILRKVASGDIKKWEKFAKEAAQDLRLMQGSLFCHIKQGDLVQKWTTGSEMGKAVEKFINCNKRVNLRSKRNQIKNPNFRIA